LNTDKALLKEATKELWQIVKKLRPNIDKEARLQLVLKALITIGDLPNQIDAAIVVGSCSELEGEGEGEPKKEEEESTTSEKSQLEDNPNGRRVVRRRSAAG